MWVPPFPNDSGSAIGAACSALAAQQGFRALEWSVYSGPAVRPSEVPPEWEGAPCTMGQLAAILACDKPVVFLAGRAELGPRALGGRSILAAASWEGMKDHLNDVKLREHFRPVAPICTEDRAAEIFSLEYPIRTCCSITRRDQNGGTKFPPSCISMDLLVYKPFLEPPSIVAELRRIREAHSHSAALQYQRQSAWTRLFPGCCRRVPVGTRRSRMV